MMKLTVAFLATLAAADAANTHPRRHARRDGYGYAPIPSSSVAKGTTTLIVSPVPIESPSSAVASSAVVSSAVASSSVLSVQGSTFVPSSSVVQPGGGYGKPSGTSSGTVPSSVVVETPAGSSVAPPVGGTGVPSVSGYPVVEVPSSVVVETPTASSVVPPVGGTGVPSGAPSSVYPPVGGSGVPSGTAPSSVVETPAGSSVAPPVGGTGVPSGAPSGVYPPVGGSGVPSGTAPSSVVVETPTASSVVPPVGGTGVPSGVYPPVGGSGVPSGTGPSSVAETPAGSSVAPPVGGGAGVPSASGYPVIEVPSSVVAETPAGSSGVPTFFPTGTAPNFPVSGTGIPSGGYAVSGVANATGGAELTTSTIFSTQIITVTACPSTVKDCPAGSTSLVTSVVAVSTTVCPKSEVSGYAGATPAPSVPGVEAVSTAASEVVVTQTETLIYTVGTGDNAHEVTTEVESTSTSTIYSTLYLTKSKAVESGVPVSGNAEATPVVTLDSTSTNTKYVTVVPSGSAGVVEGKGSVVPSSVAGETAAVSGGAGECAPPVTVTVTNQETVTVTAGQEAPTNVEGEADLPASGYPGATPTARFPVINGTNPFPGSSGFLTATGGPRPTGSVLPPPGASGTDVVVVPSGTGSPINPSSVSFELPGAEPTPASSASGTDVVVVPSGTGSPINASSVSYELPGAEPTPAPGAPTSSDSPVAGSTSEAPASSSAVDYSYGTYKKRFGLF